MPQPHAALPCTPPSALAPCVNPLPPFSETFFLVQSQAYVSSCFDTCSPPLPTMSLNLFNYPSVLSIINGCNALTAIRPAAGKAGRGEVASGQTGLQGRRYRAGGRKGPAQRTARPPTRPHAPLLRLLRPLACRQAGARARSRDSSPAQLRQLLWRPLRWRALQLGSRLEGAVAATAASDAPLRSNPIAQPPWSGREEEGRCGCCWPWRLFGLRL